MPDQYPHVRNFVAIFLLQSGRICTYLGHANHSEQVGVPNYWSGIVIEVGAVASTSRIPRHVEQGLFSFLDSYKIDSDMHFEHSVDARIKGLNK